MLVIQCDTSSFRSGRENGFKCNACRRFVGFPPRCTSVTIMSVGQHFTRVVDALAGEVLHDCRQDISDTEHALNEAAKVKKSLGPKSKFMNLPSPQSQSATAGIPNASRYVF